MVFHTRLDLSKVLTERFKAWITAYEKFVRRIKLRSIQCSRNFIGYAVYKEHYIEFEGETPGGELDKPVDISRL